MAYRRNQLRSSKFYIFYVRMVHIQRVRIVRGLGSVQKIYVHIRDCYLKKYILQIRMVYKKIHVLQYNFSSAYFFPLIFIFLNIFTRKISSSNYMCEKNGSFYQEYFLLYPNLRKPYIFCLKFYYRTTLFVYLIRNLILILYIYCLYQRMDKYQFIIYTIKHNIVT